MVTHQRLVRSETTDGFATGTAGVRGAPSLKRALDVVGASLGLVVAAPLLGLCAIAIKCTSRGPVLYSQVRIGKDGAPFRILKLRTMRADAELRLADVMHLNVHARDLGDGRMYKIAGDPRVTSVGRVIRRFSLDELPQLVNVIRGDMSLVGPRPPLPAEVAAYGDDVRRRLLVKPGLTGLWQVSGRSDLPWEECVRLDLRYVENWSISMDLLILARTFLAVIRGVGAY